MPFINLSSVTFLEGAGGNELHRSAAIVGLARRNFEPNRFVIVHYVVLVVNYNIKYLSSLASLMS